MRCMTRLLTQIVSFKMDKINAFINGMELRNNYKGEPLDILEIVKWQGSGSCYTIAHWKGGDLTFIGGRPFNENLGDFLKLAQIGHNFIQDKEEF